MTDMISATDTRALTLRQLITDPVIRLVMARDGVAEHDVQELFDRVRTSALAARWRGAATGANGQPDAAMSPSTGGVSSLTRRMTK